MDGNGRWAKARGQQRAFGHIEGVERVRDITTACVELGVRYLSLYTFSEENWNRPAEEVNALMGLMMKSIEGEYETMMRNGVRFRVLGNRARLSEQLLEAISNLEKATEGNTNMDMIIMLSYSGKWDILQAAKRMAEDFSGNLAALESLDIKDFDPYLATAGIPDPDLIIRTSGEKRLSNYLLWQAAYSEFVFVDTLWPDFRREEFLAALEEYSHRNRRYGKVK